MLPRSFCVELYISNSYFSQYNYTSSQWHPQHSYWFSVAAIIIIIIVIIATNYSTRSLVWKFKVNLRIRFVYSKQQKPQQKLNKSDSVSSLSPDTSVRNFPIKGQTLVYYASEFDRGVGYLAHAATAKSSPGDDSIFQACTAILALCFLMTVLLRALNAIGLMPVHAHND